MEEIITQAKNGNQQAMENLVAQYKSLIRSLANKYYLVGGDKDDLLQEGMLGLFYAVNFYDETKGNFPSFVKLCVNRQILDAVKRDASNKNKPLYNYVELDLLDNLADESTPLGNVLRKEYSDKVNKVIETELTPTEQTVIRLFANGYSYEDIVNKTNKSYKAVDGALQRARKKLLVIED